MKLALIYNKDSKSTTGAYIEKVIKQAGIDWTAFGIEDFSPIPKGFDLYFRIDHGDYKYNIGEDLHPAVFYVIDTHLKKPYKKIRRQVRHYDIVFCAQKEGAYRLGKETKVDTQWLPLACDPEVHKKLDVPKIYDIGFVGRNAKKFERGRHLELLKKNYPKSFIGEIDFRKMGEIYSASKIGFNSSIVNDINMRIFEIISSGCLLLTNHIKNNGFNELFESGKHLVEYKSDKNLLELIDYYLKNAEERERIAQAGYDLVINKHTYYRRVQTMFNYIAFKFGGKFNELRV